MKTITIRARYQPSSKAHIFLSSSPRTYKGDFLNSMISLPKSQVEIIEVKEIAMSLKEVTVSMPEWLYDTLPFGESEWGKKLKSLS